MKNSRKQSSPRLNRRRTAFDPLELRRTLKPRDKTRSLIMSRIRGRGNQTTELTLAHALRRDRIGGWRRHWPLAGTPDFAYPRERVAIFVDGCFWHGCVRCYKAPRHNAAFWSHKVRTNRARDRRVNRRLSSAGWKVIRLWEHSLKTEQRRQSALRRIRQAVATVIHPVTVKRR